MKFNLKARSWHTWSSLVLALPILIVGMTAIFIAHKKSLGTEEVPVSMRWLPGYRMMDAQRKGPEIRAALMTETGRFLVGTQDGLYLLKGDTLAAAPNFTGIAVRGIAEGRFGVVVAARNGVWLGDGEQWERVVEGEAWNATRRHDGSVSVAHRSKGVLLSTDGTSWQPDATVATAIANLPNEAAARPLSLHRLIMDLHTGQAFLGKSAEWIWIDLVGSVMCLLALTGVYMWWRTEKRKTAIAAK